MGQVWNSHKCVVCGKYHPEWQMVSLGINTGRVRQSKMGYVCKNKKCNDPNAISEALSKTERRD